MQFALRTTLPPSELEPQLRRALAKIDGTAFLGKVSTLQLSLDRNLAQPRLNAGLLTSFAALSLLLVVIGVYGLVAFDVAQRTRELGLRIALGSSRSGILTLLLGESSRILAAGLWPRPCRQLRRQPGSSPRCSPAPPRKPSHSPSRPP